MFLLLRPLYDQPKRFGPSSCVGGADDAYDIPDLGSDCLHRRIVMVNFWQLLACNVVERIEMLDFLFTHDLMVRNHDVFQYI